MSVRAYSVELICSVLATFKLASRGLKIIHTKTSKPRVSRSSFHNSFLSFAATTQDLRDDGATALC